MCVLCLCGGFVYTCIYMCACLYVIIHVHVCRWRSSAAKDVVAVGKTTGEGCPARSMGFDGNA